MNKNWIIGVDEAGRGPLAGPVAVGVALVPVNFDWNKIPGVDDSKQVSAKKREQIFLRAQQLQQAGELEYAVSLVAAKVIDTKGIVFAINRAMSNALDTIAGNAHKMTSNPQPNPFPKSSRSRLELVNPQPKPQPKSTSRDLELVQSLVKLDGGLRAPAEFLYQETIIKGDATEPAIGLASIMAKVTRDRYMAKVGAQPLYVRYNFAQHKGYGTKAHREVLFQCGLSPEHRVSYCKNVKSGLI